MANFKQAMDWMEVGKKVRIDSWGNKDYYWHVPDWDTFTFDNLWWIKDFRGDEACFIRSFVEAEDWVIFFGNVAKSEGGNKDE